VAHDRELTAIIEHALSSIAPGRLTALLDEAGIASAQLRSPQEFAAHPQLAARDRWREVDTPGGPVRAMLPPVTVPGREAAMGAVPAVGQHSAAIRAELGLPADPGSPPALRADFGALSAPQTLPIT
jgi:crotonobetainyl-CoA:carnitine CoA-transferase CaiB-like acyl-CoA transferase